MEYTLNLGGRLMDLSKPRVMGILNVTPDSFYAASRQQSADGIARCVDEMVCQGADIIDIGACSTRPGAELASEEEEMERLRNALAVVRRRCPGVPLSVDTFRPAVARMAIETFGVEIINDVGGAATKEDSREKPCQTVAISPMLRLVARYGVAYVLTATERDMRQTLLTLAIKVQQLRSLGQKDIIIDPGFGFGKDVDNNFRLLSQMERLAVLELPILAGLSRKSMIFKTLGCTPDEALNGTTALHAVALMKGASILRVHDVKAAREVVTLFEALKHK